MIVKSQVKYIQSLGHKKYRDEEGVFVAEGKKLVEELLGSPNLHPEQIYAVEDWLRGYSASNHPANTIQVSPSELERLSFLSTPNQVLALFRKPIFPEINFQGQITLVLDNLQDPGNLGTIVRTADWFGVRRIVCSEDSADVFNPKVVQATMGSIGRVQVVYSDLEELLTTNKKIPAYAAMLEGKSVHQINPMQEAFLVIGNEARGISSALSNLIPNKITIPRKGGAESLNAAVATGIILSYLSSK
ncbi:MAG TPA: RNA methyltransferase [Puia sp.]|nr:RNA methyltransferase [Puia sp.]